VCDVYGLGVSGKAANAVAVFAALFFAGLAGGAGRMRNQKKGSGE
jgi:hypothetical protein